MFKCSTIILDSLALLAKQMPEFFHYQQELNSIYHLVGSHLSPVMTPCYNIPQIIQESTEFELKHNIQRESNQGVRGYQQIIDISLISKNYTATHSTALFLLSRSQLEAVLYFIYRTSFKAYTLMVTKNNNGHNSRDLFEIISFSKILNYLIKIINKIPGKRY